MSCFPLFASFRRPLLAAFLAVLTAATTQAGPVPIDGGTGAFAAARNQVLYAVDFDTGKATPLFTDTLVTAINSVGFDPVRGIYYYTDNANAATNHAIFGYDTRNAERFIAVADVTAFGVTLPAAGLGAASGEFANDAYYFSTEGGGAGNADQFYRVDFVPASNGRTVQSITFVGLDNFAGATEFGDSLIDESTQRLYMFNSGVGVDEYQINAGSLAYLGRDANTGVRQSARDRNNVFYSVASVFRSYVPATGVFGASRTITTDGATGLGDVADAAAYLPAESSIGNRVFFDSNGNGVDDAEDGISGLTVQLHNDLDADGVVDAGDAVLATTTSDAAGAYLFSQLLPGDYIVRITDPTSILNGGGSTTGGFTQTEAIRLVGTAYLNHDFGFQDNRPSLTINNVSVTEGTNPQAVFTVGLTRTSSAPITVSLALADVTAGSADFGPNLEVSTNGGANWAPASTATIGAGSLSVLVRTAVIDDSMDENPETFTLTATRTAGVTLNQTVTGTGTITDNDPIPTFSIDDVTRNEDGATATFTVTLSAASGLVTSVDFASGNATAFAGTDYTTTSGTVSFPAGTTTRSITVQILDDAIFENSETFNVVLSAPANATILDGTGVGTILDDGTGAGGADDDRPTLAIDNVATTEGTDAFAIFTLSLSNQSALTTTVALTLTNGTAGAADFGPAIEVSTNGGGAWISSTSASFAPTTTSVLVRTPIINDALDENPEAFTLTGTVTAGTTTNASVTGTASIADNDSPPSVSIDDVTRNEDGLTATFTATLSGASSLPISVNYATSSGTALSGADFTPTSGTLSFAAGVVTQIITVSILDDTTFENSETFDVVLSNPTNATIADGTGVGTILDNGTGAGGTDNDAPSLSVGNVSVTEGSDASAVFPVSLSNPSAVTTTVSLALANGTAVGADYGPGLEVSTDAGANWNPAAAASFAPGSTSLLVRTPITDDALDENSEDFTLTAAVTAGTTSNPSAAGTATIADNEAAALSINDVAVSEEAGPATFTVTLSTPSALPVTVGYATAGGTATSGTDFTAASGTLTFAPGVVTQAVAVTIFDDAVFETSEAFNIVLSGATNAAIADATGVGTILDTKTIDNAPPVANPDDASTPEDIAVNVPVLPNDTDPDNDALTVTGATVPPAQGTVSINVGGTLRFTPAPNFTGAATISYAISDGFDGTASSIATITVTSVNDEPIATNDTATTPENRPVEVDVLANDSDPEGNPLTVTTATVVDGSGTVVITSSGTIEFTPAPGFTGVATVIYTISDGQGGTAAATVSIQVDALPIATDDFASTTPDTAKLIPVVANDIDPEGLPLTIIDATILPNDGTLTIDPSGQLLYTPPAGLAGSVTGSYTIRDAAGNIATADVTITISTTATPQPLSAVSDFASTVQQTPVTIPVLQNDSDPAGGVLTVITATIAAAQGSVAINPNGTLTFTAAVGFEGNAEITYSIQNPTGATASAPAIVQVTGGNAPPLAQPDSATAASGVPKIVRLLRNDTDPDGDALTVVSATLPPAQGTVQVNPDGTVTFTSAPAFVGNAGIAYQITDGNGGTSNSTVTISVSAAPVNAPPVATNDTATTPVGQTIDVPVLLNDSDPDGDLLTVTSVIVPAGQGSATINPDGTIRYIPAPGLNDDVVLEYAITDGNGGTANALVTISVNDNPVAVADRADTLPVTPVTLTILDNDSDPNGNPVALTGATSDPAEGTLTINPGGTITFTPAAGFSGIAEITYTITDGKGGTAEGTAYIRVNSPPVPVNDTASTPLDQPVIIAVLGNDTDPDGGPLTVIGATVDPVQGTVAINPDGTLTFTPAPTFTGPAIISYTITDPNGSRRSATATVTRGNLAPVAEDRTVYTYCKTAVRINALRTATDADGNSLSVIAVSQPRFGRVTIQPDGTVLYRPRLNYTSTTTDSFTVTISDGNGGTTAETITVRAFAAIAGTFQGLLADAAAPVVPVAPAIGALAGRGRLTVTLNNLATFSAKLELDGAVSRFSGTLRGALTFQRTLRIDGQLATITLTYHDLTDRWSATITGPGLSVRQNSSGINRRSRAVRIASVHRVQLAPRVGAAAPGGALIRVSRIGSVSAVGMLPDGAPFSLTSMLDGNGSAAIYDWFIPTRTSLAGNFQLPAIPNATPTGIWELSDDAAGGTVTEILDLVP
ncbi:MAG TPA: Ig-like domain-containing protein [Chthoniobacteraceae bacterium]|jgi:VCBS repeat-containing protein